MIVSYHFLVGVQISAVITPLSISCHDLRVQKKKKKGGACVCVKISSIECLPRLGNHKNYCVKVAKQSVV